MRVFAGVYPILAMSTDSDSSAAVSKLTAHTWLPHSLSNENTNTDSTAATCRDGMSWEHTGAGTPRGLRERQSQLKGTPTTTSVVT